jgi:hypothetical protein
MSEFQRVAATEEDIQSAVAGAGKTRGADARRSINECVVLEVATTL